MWKYQVAGIGVSVEIWEQTVQTPGGPIFPAEEYIISIEIKKPSAFQDLFQ